MLHIPQDQHACYKNWNASSSEMEIVILLEGFTNAERIGANCPGSSGTVPDLSLCHGVPESAQ